jgi:GntR family transcriptional regulator/MocR family aminotransferase
LRQQLGPWLTAVPSVAGLHLAALTSAEVDAAAIVEQARQNGVGIYSLRDFQVGRVGKSGLVFGFGEITEREITEGLSRLRRILSDHAPEVFAAPRGKARAKSG